MVFMLNCWFACWSVYLVGVVCLVYVWLFDFVVTLFDSLRFYLCLCDLLICGAWVLLVFGLFTLWLWFVACICFCVAMICGCLLLLIFWLVFGLFLLICWCFVSGCNDALRLARLWVYWFDLIIVLVGICWFMFPLYF